MKKTFGYLLKIFAAVVIAAIVLSLFSMVYYNPPIATEQPDGITNFRYLSNSKWAFMLEGFGYGATDNSGYNSEYYNDLTDPDIVFAGSSHMEALQVPGDANCVYLLNEKFDKDDLSYNNFKCLNLGMSGHFFEVTASNFANIANRFKDAKYIVIEVFNVEYSPETLDQILEEKFREPIEKKGAIYEAAQKIPFVRLMYKKLNETLSAAPVAVPTEGEKSVDMNLYSDKMNAVLGKIAKISAENGVKPIIMLHGRFWEDDKGEIVSEMNETYKDAFEKCCAANGIDVIDISPAMISEYKENFKFSYGFSNSAPGEGHLNETGHRIIAETMYKYINEKEGNK